MMLKVKVAYRKFGTGKLMQVTITAESYEEAIKLFIAIHPFDHLVSVQ